MAAKFVAPMLLIFFLALLAIRKQSFKRYDVLSTTFDIDEDRDIRPTGGCLRVLLLLICGDVKICPGQELPPCADCV